MMRTVDVLYALPNIFLVILLMVGFNSLFAAYEIALASVTIARLQVLARENHRGAKAALYMKENFEASLASVQLGITVLGAIAAATGAGSAGSTMAVVPVAEMLVEPRTSASQLDPVEAIRYE